MAQASDFTILIDDREVKIGDSNLKWERKFNLPGVEQSYAILIFNVRGLKNAKMDPKVILNGKEVGKIYRYETRGNAEVSQKMWFTQMIIIEKGFLDPVTNKIVIGAVPLKNPRVGNKYDDFWLKTMWLHYHKTL